MPSPGNWVMAIMRVLNLCSSICLCHGCLAWWPMPCFRWENITRALKVGCSEVLIAVGGNIGGSHGESNPCSLPAWKALPCSFTAPFSQSSSTTSGVLELVDTCLACESELLNFLALWEPLGFTLVAMVGVFVLRTTNQSPPTTYPPTSC